MKHDAIVHKRFLDYRDKHEYFGKKLALLSYEDFAKLDAEHALLDAKGEDARDDEETARFDELSEILIRD